jgi:hypothetical protein
MRHQINTDMAEWAEEVPLSNRAESSGIPSRLFVREAASGPDRPDPRIIEPPLPPNFEQGLPL